MKKIENFTNCYDLSKTLRFRLIPVGDTAKNFEEYRQLEKDELLGKDYKKIKELLDEFYKGYIDETLKEAVFSAADLEKYAELYFNADKTSEESAQAEKLKKSFYSVIKQVFSVKDGQTDPFKGEMIKKLLLPSVKEEDKGVVQNFARFSTYLTGFFDNRKNMVTVEGKSTEVAFRLFDQNLPKFLNNVKIFNRNVEKIKAIIENADDRLKNMTDISAMFTPAGFAGYVRQKDIDVYNAVIGGFVAEDGEKIKGLNEYINESNQVSENKIPKFSPLYKQILSDREAVSFLPEKFVSDEELLSAVFTFYRTNGKELLEKTNEVFDNIGEYFFKETYLSYREISQLSERLYSGDAEKFPAWRVIKDYLSEDYDGRFSEKERSTKKYVKEKEDYFKNLKAVKIAEIERLSGKDLQAYYSAAWKTLFEKTENAFEKFSGGEAEPLLKSDGYVEKLKGFLDAMKDVYNFLKGFDCEENGSSPFFAEINQAYIGASGFTALYDKVRNYVTQKPYDTQKIKINFENSQLLNGWDITKESEYNSALLRKDGNYFLAVMRKDCNRALQNIGYSDGEEYYEKMIYKYLPSPSKMLPKVCFAENNRGLFNPSARIEEIREKELFKKGETFEKSALCELIDFYKDCIKKYDSWKGYDFSFAPTEDYSDISGFYRDVERAGYSVKFNKISKLGVDRLVKEGKLYLFRLYNKDFSAYSHGNKNLHTLYFTEIFSEENLKCPVFKLNGQAEVFYRPASIECKTPTHPKNNPIKNKNPNNEKKTSVFEYDLIKDKRYTENQFFFHVPMQMNFMPDINVKINERVRENLKSCPDNYDIGIDRGERNLLYVSVIDGKGKIVEQSSLNVIDGQDYYGLLTERQKSREQARREWKEVENIKDLKKGYLSLVVNKICKLIEKYDAIVAMEDLNFGFKNIRSGIEKSVYQQFEKALIDKLNFFVDKQADKNAYGGLRKAYQLTEKFKSFSKMGKQNGFLFYVPAWNTSKIDPSTGFVDLLKPKYKSVEDAKAFIFKIDKISYVDKMFAFDIDYSAFPRAEADYKKKWTIYTNGDRIVAFRSPAKADVWDFKSINVAEEFKALFNAYGVDYEKGDIKSQILARTEKDFFERFMKLLALTLQMRNSISGTSTDYIISPVKDKNGNFFDSRSAVGLPVDADANGAYHIALKGIWAIEQIKSSADVGKAQISINNAEWLKFRQSR